MDPVILSFEAGPDVVNMASGDAVPVLPWVRMSLTGSNPSRPTPQICTAGRVFDQPNRPPQPWPQSPTQVQDLLDRLIDCHWGEYVAVITAPDGESVCLLPEPTGLVDVYYAHVGQRLVAATSYYGIRSLMGTDLAPNDSHLVDGALALDRYGPGTPFEGVNRIPFGHALEISKTGQTRLVHLWPRRFEDNARSPQKVDGELEELLTKVVQCQASPQSGLMLSGGRDSSLIAGLIARADRPDAGTLHCIHTHSPGSSSENELDFAQFVTDAIGAKLHVFGPDDMMKAAQSSSDLQPDEHGVLTLPLEAMFEHRTGCRHFLDGKGGDTVFVDTPEAAYITHRSFSDIARDTQLDRNFNYLVTAKIMAPLRPHIYLRDLRWRFLRQFNAMSLLTKKAETHYAKAENWRFFRDHTRQILRHASLAKATYVSVVLGDMLYQTHRAPTRHTLSYPFLAQPVLDYMFTLDLGTIYGRENRTLQRRMLRKFGLEKVAERQFKSGMTSINMRANTQLERQQIDTISNGHLIRQGLIDHDVIHRIMSEMRAGVPSLGLHAFSKVSMLERLYKVHGPKRPD